MSSSCTTSMTTQECADGKEVLSNSKSPLVLDTFARNQASNSKGRGSISGWTACPICCPAILSNDIASQTNTKAVKKFALGRGITAHIQLVHTPWKPKKMELKRREKLRRRLKGLVHCLYHDTNDVPNFQRIEGESEQDCYQRLIKKELQLDLLLDGDGHSLSVENHDDEQQDKKSNNNIISINLAERDGIQKPVEWTPTAKEIEAWNANVLRLTQLVEKQQSQASSSIPTTDLTNESNILKNNEHLNRDTEVTTKNDQSTQPPPTKRRKMGNLDSTLNPPSSTSFFVKAGLDRNGNQTVQSYKNSLPPFLLAASEGNLERLKEMVAQITQETHRHNSNEENQENDKVDDVKKRKYDAMKELIETRDRNGSTAEHWAAGGGHLSCVKYLNELFILTILGQNAEGCTHDSEKNKNDKTDKAEHSMMISAESENTVTVNHKRKRNIRRRDGKTSLHYAARNGHNHVIDFLLLQCPKPLEDGEEKSLKSTTEKCSELHDQDSNRSESDVDVVSGDGTTPLHLACYGGHLHTVKHLIEKYNANLDKVNDWGCGVGHWLAISIHPDPNELHHILNYTKTIRKTLAPTTSNRRNLSCVSFSIFGLVQKQGHSAIHKAAQKLNKSMIQWLVKEAQENWTKDERELAGGLDSGGNCPSDIWSLMGGEDDFAVWMKTQCGW